MSNSRTVALACGGTINAHPPEGAEVLVRFRVPHQGFRYSVVIYQPSKDHILPWRARYARFREDDIAAWFPLPLEPPIPFWESLTIDEIAARQGVTGPTDIDALPGVFESDKEVDEFLDSIRGPEPKMFVLLNRARGFLIDRNIAGTLTDDERAHLEALNAFVDARIAAIHGPARSDAIEAIRKHLTDVGKREGN